MTSHSCPFRALDYHFNRHQDVASSFPSDYPYGRVDSRRYYHDRHIYAKSGCRTHYRERTREHAIANNQPRWVAAVLQYGVSRLAPPERIDPLKYTIDTMRQPAMDMRLTNEKCPDQIVDRPATAMTSIPLVRAGSALQGIIQSINASTPDRVRGDKEQELIAEPRQHQVFPRRSNNRTTTHPSTQLPQPEDEQPSRSFVPLQTRCAPRRYHARPRYFAFVQHPVCAAC